MDKSYYLQLGENYETIGATLHFAHIDDKNIVEDCGLGNAKNEKGEEIRYLPHQEDFLDGKHIDLILISHAHDDHIGAIPRLVSKHPEATVLISQPTFQIAEIIFEDALKIMNSDGGHLFWERDVDMFFDNPRLRIIRPGEVGWLKGMGKEWEGWKIGSLPSGHYAGALSFCIISPSGKRLMITGDTSDHEQRSVPGISFPENGFMEEFRNGEVTLVMEGTNASRRRTKTRAQIESELDEFIQKVKAKNGTAFFPCFGRQRAAELALTLIDLGYGVHIDGIARVLSVIEVPSLMNHYVTGKLRFFEGRRFAADYHRRKAAIGTCKCCGQDPPIIIAPSAILKGGYSIKHSMRIFPGSNNGAGYVGHLFRDTPADDVFRRKKGRVFLNNMGEITKVDVNCMTQTFDLTAHAYQEGLVNFVDFVRPHRVISHHCPGFEDFVVLQDEILKLKNKPKEIYYAPAADKIEL
jgi:Cft2 family RNA processing exonuclease